MARRRAVSGSLSEDDEVSPRRRWLRSRPVREASPKYLERMAYVALPVLVVLLALIPEGPYVAVARRLQPIWRRFQTHVAQ